MKKIVISLRGNKSEIYLECPLKRVGDLLERYCCGKKAFIITDETVNKLYAEAICVSVQKTGRKVQVSVIKNGESSKTFNVAYRLLKECSLFGMDRSDTIIAIGGGVVTDIAGFVSSIYLRGIKLVSIPTTLLAQVDASIGGKTAVNLPWGKNLVGSFHQPLFVLMDFSTLKTLPSREISQGIAEIIKTAIIRSKELFNFLKKNNTSEITKKFMYVISQCVIIKKKVVEQDERETKRIR